MENGMSEVFRLYYREIFSTNSQLIFSAPSIEELKAHARGDSRKKGRLPERYRFEHITVGLLFNTEECRQVSIYNSTFE